MSSNSLLQTVNVRGWRSGLANMLRKENRMWWRTRKWWVQCLIWTVILNGVLAITLWANSWPSVTRSMMVSMVLEVFMRTFGVGAAIGVIVLTQDAIVGEKQSGTAEWILSNPVSRSAFVLSKLIANAISALVIMVVLQGVIAFAQISVRAEQLLPAPSFVAAMGLQSLNLLFYLTLTLMLGTLFRGRGAVIGIPIGVAVSQELVVLLLGRYVPWLPPLLPGRLYEMASVVAQGRSLPSFTAIISVSVMSLVFVLVALWRFGREEF